MSPRTCGAAIVLVTFVIWMGSRATAIALPLVALDQTGAAWTTGLVLGGQSLPLVTVGWWGARLRERITTGRAIAVVMLVQVAGLAIVPVAALWHRVDVVTLVACGLVVGATSALDAPAIRALLSDLSDDLGPGHAARALTLQDLAHRCTMFLAPPLGALAVGHGHTMSLLWSECAAVGVGAIIVAAVPGRATEAAEASSVDADTEPARALMWAALRRHRRMAASMGVHGVVCVTWFAFGLGLAIEGARTHRPGELIAAGMTGYGVASTLTSFLAPASVNRLPAWPTAILPTAALGMAFIVLPTHLDSVPAVIVLAALGGLAMPVGIAAHNRILATDPAPGPERRASFAADQIIGAGGSALGMLLGGAIIAAIGIPATLTAAGILQIAAVLVALRVGRRSVTTTQAGIERRAESWASPSPRHT